MNENKKETRWGKKLEPRREKREKSHHIYVKTFSSDDIHVIPINFIGRKTWLEIYFYDATRIRNEEERAAFEDADATPNDYTNNTDLGGRALNFHAVKGP